MAAKVDSRGGTRPTKVTFNRAGNVQNVGNFAQANEENHEMHIKMSKKIAQLTKVIFSLNTKNDEFEEIIEGLKSTHNEELQRVNVESKEKIVHYKQKLELVKEQETLINKLQCLLEDERSDKRQFVADFEKFKLEKNQHEEEVQSKYETKMTEIINNLTKLKNEFENRTQQFEKAKKKFENERENLASELSHKHSLEMEKLIKAHRIRYDDLQNENVKLQKEIDDIKSERTSELSNKDSDMKSLIEEHEAKCEKLKKFYQNELSAAKQQQEVELNEKVEKLKNEEKILQASTKRSEETLRNRIKALNENNEKLEGRIEELEMTVKSANEELNKTSNNNDHYSKEVSHLRQELSVADVRLKGIQNELNSVKGRYDMQSEDLLKKSAELGSLEAAKIAHCNTIKDLTSEVEELRKRCYELESERKNLGRQLSANSSESHVQIKSLKRDLERFEEEKKRTLGRLEKEMEEREILHNEKIKETREGKDAEFNNLIEKHKKDIEELKLSHAEDVKNLEERAQRKHDEFVDKLQGESRAAIGMKVKNIEDLEETLKQYENEISKLNVKVNEESSKNASSSDEVITLQSKLNHLQNDLDQARINLKASVEKASGLENKLATNEKKHEKEIENAELKLQKSLKGLQAELNQQWAEKMRNECENLRNALLAQQKEASDAAIKQMITLKEKELEAYKRELQQQVSRYQQQVSQLRQDLQNSNQENLSLLRKNTEEVDKQRASYEDEISKLKFDHSGEIEILYLENEKRLKGLSEKYDIDLKKIEEQLKSEHQETLSGIMMANRAAIDAMKLDSEKQKKDEIEEMGKQHSEEKERLRQTLHVQHKDELEQQNLQFEEELEYVKDELKKTKELRTKEFGIHTSKIEELMNLMKTKDEEMRELERRLDELQENVRILTHELEEKVEEIRKVRREGNINMRRREQQLAKEHQNEVDELTADHLRETQKILAEFNRAKELLKDKIEALQLLLEQAEARYRNRESRPEDLDAIENLKKKVSDRELECQKLVEEKRFFQLELLNRETNFNKIFSSMPNVGVINPLEASKKKRKTAKDQWNLTGRSSQRPSSGSSSPARLEPLHHPQIHDQRLNNSKPLPKAPVKGL